MTLNEKLVAVAISGNLEKIKELLVLGADPKSSFSAALRLAAANGHVECARLLLPISNPKDDNSWALRLAARYGHTECVRMLLPVSDAKDDDSEALIEASENGHAECVKLLIPVSGQTEGEASCALRLAADNGHAECVRLLIPFSEPKAFDSQALMNAARYGHSECVRMLAEPSGFGLVVEELLSVSSVQSWMNLYHHEVEGEFYKIRMLQRAREEALALQSSIPVAPAAKKSGRL